MNPQNLSTRQNTLKRKAIYLLIFVVIIYALLWIARQSYIEITIPNAGKATASYTLSNSKKKVSGNIPKGSFKKKLSAPKGEYELLVTQDESSYYINMKTSGFFRKTTVSAQLTKENDRSYVGDNPGGCFDYISSLLVSGGCAGLYSKMATHMPATPTTPTFTLTDPVNASRQDTEGAVLAETMEGIANTPEGTFALVQTPETGNEIVASHSIYSFKPEVNAGRMTLVRTLPNADAANTYHIQVYKQGFITYDSKFSNATYHANAAAEPADIKLDAPSNAGLTPLQLSSSDNQILALYSNANAAANSKKISLASEAILGVQGAASHFTFKKNYTSGFPCGTKKLCLIGEAKLDVYDISGKTPKQLYTVNDVRAAVVSGKSLYAVRSDGIVRIDTDNRTGFRSYSLGKYDFVNIKAAGKGYVVGIADSRGGSAALLFSDSPDSSGEIDKKVSALRDKVGELQAVSTYGQYVFVTPYLGEQVYDESAGFYNYNQETLRAVASKIDKAVKDAGIDSAKFKVINTTL